MKNQLTINVYLYIYVVTSWTIPVIVGKNLHYQYRRRTQKISTYNCINKQIKIVKNILLEDCLLVRMYQEHRDNVIRMNGVFIKWKHSLEWCNSREYMCFRKEIKIIERRIFFSYDIVLRTIWWDGARLIHIVNGLSLWQMQKSTSSRWNKDNGTLH